MQQRSGSSSGAPVEVSLAAQVRDSLVVDETVIIAIVNEVVGEMPAHTAEVFRRLLKASAGFRASVKRVTVDVGVVLALAKSFESDDTFSASAGLIHDVDFAGHEGKLGQFAKAMIESDLRALEKAVNGELEEEETVYYAMLPSRKLEGRLRLLLAFADHALRQSA
jgi:predicted hydrolase (HD superfamily)